MVPIKIVSLHLLFHIGFFKKIYLLDGGLTDEFATEQPRFYCCG